MTWFDLVHQVKQLVTNASSSSAYQARARFASAARYHLVAAQYLRVALVTVSFAFAVLIREHCRSLLQQLPCGANRKGSLLRPGS